MMDDLRSRRLQSAPHDDLELDRVMDWKRARQTLVASRREKAANALLMEHLRDAPDALLRRG
jgi:hypothetical protein